MEDYIAKHWRRWNIWQKLLCIFLHLAFCAGMVLTIAFAFEYILGLFVIVFGTPAFIAEALKGSDMSDKS